MTQLSEYRFPANKLQTKPGPRGLKLTYVDMRDIAEALDELVPGWASKMELGHTGSEYYAICTIVVDGVARADTGSGDTPPDASNQAFRRAAAAHGLGRYLWQDGPTPQTQPKPQPQRPAAAQTPAQPQADKSRLAVLDQLIVEYYGPANAKDKRIELAENISKGATWSLTDLTDSQIDSTIIILRNRLAEQKRGERNDAQQQEMAGVQVPNGY